MKPLTESDFASATRRNSFASLFISDMHLGARSCREDALLSFLQAHHADRIYLVGDIFDTWQGLPSDWTDKTHAIIQLLLRRAEDGVEIVYTPGNHDASFRKLIGTRLGNVTVEDHVVHKAIDGRRYLVIHGDSVDILSGRFPVLSRLVAKAEHVFRGLGNVTERLLQRFDLPIAAQVDRLVARVNDALRARDNFQERLAALAKQHGCDGIICGHYNQPALHDDYGVTYANCGDWVENSTALVETDGGQLRQVDWLLAHEARQVTRSGGMPSLAQEF